MPPLKEYKFENELNSNISITIKAYGYEEAMEVLIVTVKYPAVFIHKPSN